MLVIVRCAIFDGNQTTPADDNPEQRLTHVYEGEVLGAWRAIDNRSGVALLQTTSMAMIPDLLNEAFPNARHIDVEDVLPVEAVSTEAIDLGNQPPDNVRQTGT